MCTCLCDKCKCLCGRCICLCWRCKCVCDISKCLLGKYKSLNGWYQCLHVRCKCLCDRYKYVWGRSVWLPEKCLVNNVTKCPCLFVCRKDSPTSQRMSLTGFVKRRLLPWGQQKRAARSWGPVPIWWYTTSVSVITW